MSGLAAVGQGDTPRCAAGEARPEEQRDAAHLVGNAEHDYGPPVVVVKVDSLGHLAARDGEQYSAAAVVARLRGWTLRQFREKGVRGARKAHPTVVLERGGRLDCIGRLDEDELVLEDLV